MSGLERWHWPTRTVGSGFYHFLPGDVRPGKRSRPSSLSSLNSHIFARGEIRAHDTSTPWSAIKDDEHEENEESVVEDEEPAEDQ
jgi:hypothetical protein